MARKQSLKTARSADSSPSETGEAPPEATAGREQPPTKTAAIRMAIAAGAALPKAGSEYIKREFGLDVSPEHFSSIKSTFKKKAAAGRTPRKPRALVEGYLAPPPRAAAAGESELLAAMEAMKPLVDNLGPDKVKRIVDLLG